MTLERYNYTTLARYYFHGQNHYSTRFSAAAGSPTMTNPRLQYIHSALVTNLGTFLSAVKGVREHDAPLLTLLKETSYRDRRCHIDIVG